MIELFAVGLLAVAGTVGTSPPEVPRSDMKMVSRLSVSEDDYPQKAFRSREQGDAELLLTVAPSGKVSGCVISTSSGSASLDTAGCKIAKRLRFQLRLDPSGVPAEVGVRFQMAWRMTDACPPDQNIMCIRRRDYVP